MEGRVGRWMGGTAAAAEHRSAPERPMSHSCASPNREYLLTPFALRCACWISAWVRACARVQLRFCAGICPHMSV